jgi:glycosyltransferase involved in cell wall biosynthesis
MFTVVIPTMWKPDTFEEQLNDLCLCEYVDEIILIDNDISTTPSFEILKNKKLLKINPLENLVVNPSWNLGVRLSLNNNICLLNDDLLMDMKVFEFMSNHKDKSLSGLSMCNQDGDIRLSEANERTHGFGCMMFIRKDTYTYIPHELLMYYGDDYLFHMNKFNKNKNYYILGCNNNEVWGKTSSSSVKVNDSKSKVVYCEGTTFERLMNEKSIVFYSE